MPETSLMDLNARRAAAAEAASLPRPVAKRAAANPAPVRAWERPNIVYLVRIGVVVPPKGGARLNKPVRDTDYHSAWMRQKRAAWRAQGLNNRGKPRMPGSRKYSDQTMPPGLYRNHAAYSRAWKALRKLIVKGTKQ